MDLVLRDAVNEFNRALRDELQSVYSRNSIAGRLHSGATVRAAIRTMDDIASNAVQSLSEKVTDITRDPDAFAAFKTAICDMIEFSRDELSTVVRMASGRLPCEPDPAIEAAALALFDDMESKIERKIEIIGFHFANNPATPAPIIKEQSTKTGRPRSAFWDDMWASIARDLYEGDLMPQSQTDVETAMLRWIEDHGYSAAVSTVRARARRLWDLICT